MRIGIIGGTFDPIHLGHMLIAKEARTRLELDRILFVPAGAPPHKTEQPVTDPGARLTMVQLAISDYSHYGVSRLDIDRRGPSYTVDTIRLLRDEWGMDAEIYFLIGADSLIDLPIWRQPEHLLRLCQVVALRRPGYEVDLGELDRLLPEAAFLVRMMDLPMLDISSTEIRQRVRQGESISHLVPPAVERYIIDNGLYRDEQKRL